MLTEASCSVGYMALPSTQAMQKVLDPWASVSYAPVKADEDERTHPKAEERWLLFLCVVTAALLVFQIAAGMIGNSVALIADSAHSSVDLVAYGINFFIEYRKSWAATLELETQQDAKVFHQQIDADLIGCVISTVMLCAATFWASKESLARLLSTPDAGDFEGVGPALLSFAVVSTLANVATLWAYSYCRRLDSQKQQSSPAEGGEPLLPPLPSPPALPAAPPPPPPPPEVEAAPDSLEIDEPPVPACVPAVPQLRQSERRLKKKRLKLDLRADFKSVASPCVDPDCEGGRSCSTSAACGTACSHASSGDRSFSAMLHRIVHPGCNGRHGEAEEDNLNVTSAILHLVADVLRGVTILLVAILIEVRVITDPGTADAICALFVAAFVALGSVALLRRATSLVCQPKAAQADDLSEAEVEAFGLPIQAGTEMPYL
eukprot:TRINITY_DN15132_c0_g1_i1.p1 TRINITY_DN15132_c0_g1~~TRINITY_DN15132_c0_g1_i1.p1  ORF type:complete len:434 (+),score=92.55 TRINITY_DN15132_c0_g1_i1:76-1377(+)